VALRSGRQGEGQGHRDAAPETAPGEDRPRPAGQAEGLPETESGSPPCRSARRAPC
jgi:hypothetical protein